MGSTRDDDKLCLSVHSCERLAVQRDHLLIIGADDQQRRCANMGQCLAGQVGPAAARDHGANRVGALRRRGQCCGGAGAGAEVANVQVFGFMLCSQPAGHVNQALRQQPDNSQTALVGHGLEEGQQGGGVGFRHRRLYRHMSN